LTLALLFATQRDKEGSSALIDAALTGREEITRALLRARAECRCSDNNGHTPLTEAAVKGHRSTVDMLLDAKADIDHGSSTGDTALIEAARHGHTEAVMRLIERKAALTTTNQHGHTALDFALERHHRGAAKTLKAACEGKPLPDLTQLLLDEARQSPTSSHNSSRKSSQRSSASSTPLQTARSHLTAGINPVSPVPEGEEDAELEAAIEGYRLASEQPPLLPPPPPPVSTIHVTRSRLAVDTGGEGSPGGGMSRPSPLAATLARANLGEAGNSPSPLPLQSSPPEDAKDDDEGEEGSPLCAAGVYQASPPLLVANPAVRVSPRNSPKSSSPLRVEVLRSRESGMGAMYGDDTPSPLDDRGAPFGFIGK